MRRWPFVGFGLAVLWLFVRNVEPTLSSVAGEFLIGLAVGLPVAFAFRRFYSPELDLGARLRGVPYVAAYFTLFTWELLTANVDVARRVLSPSMPIEPEVIELPLRVESDLAITTIANSITLTPGTLTMDYDDERNSLYVHAIDGRDPDAVVAPIRSWEDYALLIFDEERDPDDPAPTVTEAAGSAIDPRETGGDPAAGLTREGGDDDGE